MRIPFAACATHASIDKITNGISLFNVIEKVSPAGFPSFLGNTTYVAIVRREANDPQTIKGSLFIRMDRDDLFQTPFVAEFVAELNGIQWVIGIQGIPILRAGNLNFSLELENGVNHTFTVLVEPLASEVKRTMMVPTGTPATQPAAHVG